MLDGTMESNNTFTPEETKTDEATKETETTEPEKKETKDSPKTEETKEEKSAYQRRIDTLTYERRKAENERDRVLALLEKSIPNKSENKDEEKTPEKFETIEEYTDYLVEKKMAEKMAMMEKTNREKTAQEKTQENINRFSEKANAFTAKHPDFFDKINDPTLPTTEVIQGALIESENGPDVAYYLANNREELSRIVNLTPYAQAIAIGKIEAKLSSEQPTGKTTKAPDPIRPVKGGISIDDGPSDKMSMDDWVKAEKARLKKIGRLR